MPNTSRENISRAGSLFQGSVAQAVYQGGKAGVQITPLLRWRPTGKQPLTFTGAVAVGAFSATLAAAFGPPSGLYQVTLSNGQIVEAALAQGQTTCSFYETLPLVGAPAAVGALSASTAIATIQGMPPVLGTSTQVAASQGVGAGALFALNGTYLNNLPGSSTQTVNGVVYQGCIVPDMGRNLVGAWTTASTITVSGFDVYNQPMSEVQTGTTFTGKKAFTIITSIKSSAAITAATFGFGNAIGLPFTTSSGDWLSPMMADVPDAGVFVPRDYTIPATPTTGDTRGTYTPAAAFNGAKFLAALIKVADTAAQYGSFGVTPA